MNRWSLRFLFCDGETTPNEDSETVLRVPGVRLTYSPVHLLTIPVQLAGLDIFRGKVKAEVEGRDGQLEANVFDANQVMAREAPGKRDLCILLSGMTYVEPAGPKHGRDLEQALIAP